VTGVDPSLADHLFRHEAGRMVASLVRALGLRQLALAEDAVQDALVRALETWRFGGVPRNPAAWLMRAARNRALDLLRRQGTAARLSAALLVAAGEGEAAAPDPERPVIPDDELRLMFSCCAPELPAPAQVAVILKYLCGFSVREIAQAFLTTEAAVEKQLYRARAALEAAGALYDVGDPAQVEARLPQVLDAVYLLFNEGYHGAHPQAVVREELCGEALRLALLLARLPGAGPEPRALLALFCFLAARLDARISDGELVLLAEQDRSRWDRALVAEGFRWLDASAEGRRLTPLHLEAAIAAAHAAAPSLEGTDWPAVRRLYDRLLALRPSPVVALNRAIALGMAEGAEAGLEAIRRIDGLDRLARYPFLHAAVAELELRRGRRRAAGAALREAVRLARNPAEEALLVRKLAACGGGRRADA
jgi:RNA polymerase sigma-70 factor (ECF subfamily)